MEQVAPRALGRRQPEVRLIEQRCQQWRVHGTARGPGAILVIGAALVTRDPQIHQDIAGTGIEARHATIAMQHADIADATDIHNDARGVWCAECSRMKGRHQRRTLATGSDIAAAKVGDHVQAGQFGQQRRIVGLAREAQLGAMADRLAMHGHGSDLAGAGRQQRPHAVGVGQRQRIGGQRLTL